MSLEAFDWNVVVAGYWNPAILTPAGIAQRLFGLAEGSPVLVEVPIDGLAPYRVRHDNLTVTAEMGRLVVNADSPHYALLDRARGIAIRAIEALPETPLTAAGFNVRVKIGDPPNELLAALGPPLDHLLSDAALVIEGSGLTRALKTGDGVLNLAIRAGTDITVEFNFHRQSSKHDELVSWLKYPIKDVDEIVSLVFDKVIRIPLGQIGK